MIFSPIKIGSLEVSNRIVVAPMCQYSAINGIMTDWHTQHLMQLGFSAAGLIMVEATAVEKLEELHITVLEYMIINACFSKKNFN